MFSIINKVSKCEILAEMQVIFCLKSYFLSSEFLSKILDISNFTFQSKDMEKDEDLSEK